MDWKSIISKRLLPDEVIYVLNSNTLFVLEKKFQTGSGSVDEKLQTCDFKKKQYVKLFQDIPRNVEYIYVLSDWFTDNKYKDYLDDKEN